MSERAYTVREIDALRKECERRWMHGFGGTHVIRLSVNTAEMSATAEAMTQTYMMAGLSAEDIMAEDGVRGTPNKNTPPTPIPQQ